MSYPIFGANLVAHITAVLTQGLERADAIVVSWAGTTWYVKVATELYRTHWTTKILLLGDQQRELREFCVRQGVKTEHILTNDDTQSLREQAVNTMALAKEKD